MSALVLALDSARAAVFDRRHELGERTLKTPQGHSARSTALVDAD
jgi:hypothetical protein